MTFTDYVKRERAALRRHAYRLCGDWSEADDLTQDTLLAIYTRWDRLDRKDELCGYARQVMARAHISERRRGRRSREIPEAEPPQPRRQHEPHRQVADRLTLLGTLSALAPRQRAAVVLRYWEDLSVERTAQILGCAPATVTSQTTRALATLRHTLTTL